MGDLQMLPGQVEDVIFQHVLVFIVLGPEVSLQSIMPLAGGHPQRILKLHQLAS